VKQYNGKGGNLKPYMAFTVEPYPPTCWWACAWVVCLPCTTWNTQLEHGLLAVCMHVNRVHMW